MASADISSSYRLDVDAWVEAQDPGNWSRMHGRLKVVKTSGTGRFSNAANPWHFDCNGTRIASGNWTYDYSNKTEIVIWEGTWIVYHDAEGWASAQNWSGYAYMSSASSSGAGSATASGSTTPDRIAKPPAAPSNLRIRAGSVLPTSFGVDYDRGDNRGAGIDQDHAEWSRVSDGVIVWDDAPFGVGPNGSPAGYSNPAGTGQQLLTPGTEYRVRVRSHNSAGWGGFSDYITQRTLSGGRAHDGTTWRNARWRAYDGTTWRDVRVRAHDGTNWRNTR